MMVGGINDGDDLFGDKSNVGWYLLVWSERKVLLVGGC
jgi:hypothetical protein